MMPPGGNFFQRLPDNDCGVKRIWSMNGLISIFIRVEATWKIWAPLSGRVETGTVAHDHQITFVQAGNDFIFVRRFKAKIHFRSSIL